MTLGNLTALGRRISRGSSPTPPSRTRATRSWAWPRSRCWGLQGVMIYMLVYLVMNLGAFLVVILVAQATGSESILDYRGLARRHPLAAVTFAIFLFSLTGLPPFAGFTGKWYLFYAVIERVGGPDGFWYGVLALVPRSTRRCRSTTTADHQGDVHRPSVVEARGAPPRGRLSGPHGRRLRPHPGVRPLVGADRRRVPALPLFAADAFLALPRPGLAPPFPVTESRDPSLPGERVGVRCSRHGARAAPSYAPSQSSPPDPRLSGRTARPNARFAGCESCTAQLRSAVFGRPRHASTTCAVTFTRGWHPLRTLATRASGAPARPGDGAPHVPTALGRSDAA